MAGNIKGITVEIGGDTTDLVKALSGVNKQIRSTQSDLREVERLLKLDPTNTELLAQKQRLLGDAITNTEKKLSDLRTASTQAAQALASGNLGQDKYDALQREIARTEQSLQKLKTESSSMGSSLQQGAKGLDDLGAAAERANSKISSVSKVAAGLGGAIIATVPATQEFRRDLSFLEINAQEAGVGMDSASSAFEAFNAVSGETDSSIEGVSNLLQSGFTESNLQKAVEGLAGAAIKFPDTLKIESLADGLQETLATGQATGQFGELLDRVGIGAENFSAGLANCTTEAEKQNYALQTLADAGMNDIYNGWVEGNQELIDYENAMLNMQTALSGLATAIAPIVTTVVNVATSMINMFTNLPAPIQVVIGAIIALAAAAGPLLTIITSVVSHFSMLSNIIKIIQPLFATLGGVFTSISAPVLIVVGAVAALVAIFTTLWQTNEGFRTAVIAIWEQIKAFFTTVFAQIQEIFSAFVALASAIWDNWGGTIKAVTTTIFGAIKSVISTAMSVIQGVINVATALINGDWSGAWEAAKSLVSTIWNAIKSLVKNALSAVASTISGAASSIRSAIESAFNSAISFITSLPGKALKWGREFINGLKQGIINAAQGVLDAVSGIADKITSFLHFSRPDEGPLREYEKWMPDFMAGLAKGINDNKYLVENAVAGLAAGMSANLYNETTAPGINYNKMYAAMKAANKYSNFKIVLDGRELGRGLRGMGVQFSG